MESGGEAEAGGEVLAGGVNLRELMGNSGTQFQIDTDFQAASKHFNPLMYDELIPTDELILTDESDCEDEHVMKQIESSVERWAVSSPEYLTFDDLATKMVDVLPSGDVKILILEEGSGPLIPTDAHVTLHYAAYYEGEKTSFDTTLTWKQNGAPATFKLGYGSVVPGLEIGLTTVRGPKARFHLLLTPQASWGERGVPPRIRPERTLFCVTVLAVQDVGAVESFNSLPAEEQKKFSVTIKTVDAINAYAKQQFGKEKYLNAIRNYHKSISVLQMSFPQSDEEMEQIKALMCKVYINLAICYYKLNRPKKILLMCDELCRVTNIENHCEANYWYGKAFTMLGELEDAMKYLKRAARIKPKNLDVGRALIQLEEVIQKGKAQEKNMWKKAFSEKGKKKKIIVSEEFKKDWREMCEMLSLEEGVVKHNLWPGHSQDEVEYLKMLVDDFEKLSFFEEVVNGQGKRAIIKKQ